MNIARWRRDLLTAHCSALLFELLLCHLLSAASDCRDSGEEAVGRCRTDLLHHHPRLHPVASSLHVSCKSVSGQLCQPHRLNRVTGPEYCGIYRLPDFPRTFLSHSRVFHCACAAGLTPAITWTSSESPEMHHRCTSILAYSKTFVAAASRSSYTHKQIVLEGPRCLHARSGWVCTSFQEVAPAPRPRGHGELLRGLPRRGIMLHDDRRRGQTQISIASPKVGRSCDADVF